MSRSNDDIENALRIVKDLRVQDLHAVISPFGYGQYRQGRKAQLQFRVEELLNTTDQKKVIARINEVQRQRLASLNPQSHNPNPSANMASHLPPMMSNIPRNIFPSAHCEAHRVILSPMPFHEIKCTLVPPTLLPPMYRSDAVPSHMSISASFNIPKEFLSRLSLRETDPLPRHEVMMRMCHYEPDKLHADAYPNVLKVTITNGTHVVPVQMPPLITIPQTLPGVRAEQKRQSKSVNIAPSLSPLRDSTYTIAIEYQLERTPFVFMIYLVEHLTPKILLDRLISIGPKVYEESKKMVKRHFGAENEDDIALDSVHISLLCPLARTHMTIPGRSKTCSHLQCFDLGNYLFMNEKRANWKCPVCNRKTVYTELVIDNYFAEILKAVAGKVSEVELFPDGTWKMMGLDTGKRQPQTSTQKTPETVQQKADNNKPQEDDVIVLDSSDDEEPAPINFTSNIPANALSVEEASRKRTFQQTVNASKTKPKNVALDNSVICLDDSEDDEISTKTSRAPLSTVAQNSTEMVSNLHTTEEPSSVSTQQNSANKHAKFQRSTTPPLNSILSARAQTDIALELTAFLERIAAADFSRSQSLLRS